MLTVDFDRLDVGPGHRLLDLGCGGGRHAFEARRRGATVVALDRDSDELGRVVAMTAVVSETEPSAPAASGGAVAGDALELPFADSSFDRIVASEVLEHVWADELAISEIARVLRPGGRLAVTVPSAFPERVCWALDFAYHDTPGGHVRIYRRADLEQKLVSGGLTVRDAHRVHALHSPYWWVRCAFGVGDEHAWPVRNYRRLLEWQIVRRPVWLDRVDRALNPVLGKSLVLYGEKVA